MAQVISPRGHMVFTPLLASITSGTLEARAVALNITSIQRALHLPQNQYVQVRQGPPPGWRQGWGRGGGVGAAPRPTRPWTCMLLSLDLPARRAPPNTHTHAHTCTHMHTHAHTCTHMHTHAHAHAHPPG
jgi:hypothetical protein